MPCPRCISEVVMKDGTTQLGGQRFRCSRYGRRFTRRSISAFSRRAFPDDVIALAIRWYVRYRLSYAEVREWLAERGILVDQSTIYRWVQRSGRCSVRRPESTASRTGLIGELTRPTLAFAAVGTTFIAP